MLIHIDTKSGEVTERIWTPPDPLPPSENDLIVELERRLALGFDFDFGDERGIHNFGTTQKDMERWMQEVTPLAQSAMNQGDTGKQISIKTETGPVSITASEWWEILEAAGEWRQPIYLSYFSLKSQQPIPVDYRDDSLWQPR